MPTVLIELPDGEGVVRRDDGEIVVTKGVSGNGGQLLRSSDPLHPSSEEPTLKKLPSTTSRSFLPDAQ